tara:strand:- start:320 stop:583 length:264 start_codon:yes stop_codon:yes gene_type:complete
MRETKINEGITDAVARATALAIKRKVILTGRKVRTAQDLENKIDELSKQVSALSALVLLGISVGGDGLLSKAGVVSGLFTEDYEDAE